MANYYEMLKIQPAASSVEITEALEVQYNQWRRLVTHHDPNIVNQANQALAKLEQIRATLTDTAKRNDYDTAIEVHGPTAGLADPEAILRDMTIVAVMTPSARTVAGTAAESNGLKAATTSSLWACPRCQTENPPMSEHCFKCGATLIRICPECSGLTSLISTGVCGKCGYSFDIALQRKKFSQQILEIKNERKMLEKGLSDAKNIYTGATGIPLVIQIVGAIGLALAGFYFLSYSEILFGLVFLALAIALPWNIVVSSNNRKGKQEKINQFEQLLAQKQKELEGTQKLYKELTRSR